MENILEQYRCHLAPILYECLEQLYEKITEKNDMGTYTKWKELTTNLSRKDTTVSTACMIFMTQLKEEYKIIIMNMLVKYERNPLNRNRS